MAGWQVMMPEPVHVQRREVVFADRSSRGEVGKLERPRLDSMRRRL